VIYEHKADPGTTSFTPRPDWYFYFLFYLLRIFKWPDSVILGTVGIPTIALVLLIVLPFLDRRQERRLLHRPVAMVAFVLTVIAMGVLTYKGATAKEATGGDAEELITGWIEQNNLSEDVRPGAELFATSGCLNCHVYAGDGAANLGAPELTDIGAQEGKDADYLQRYIADPTEFGNTVMPRFESLGEQNLSALAEFLAASKGGGG
jgi:menaquinol-cytochrome c reductase cytochrome b/c subunit